MRVELAYGEGRMAAEVPDEAVVVRPREDPGLRDPERAVRSALASPRGTRPLPEIVRGRGRVAVVTPDITRPMPLPLVLGPLIDTLLAAGVLEEQVILVNGTGSHRANTPEELEGMYGADITRRFRVVNHDAFRPETLVRVGRTPNGTDAWLNRDFVEAEVKIVTGLIEPHFFAGFSGGAKGIYPALAGIDSIMGFHSAAQIGDARSTWGVLEGNPHQIECQAVWGMVKPDFLLNVTVNSAREITGVFAGSLEEAFFAGARFAREAAMTAVPGPGFDIVITTNSGYPLDQNLYQAVKGISAAAQICRPGGAILCAAECRDGLPAHGEFRHLMRMEKTPADLLSRIEAPDFHHFDQWEAQTLAKILTRARVLLRSEMPDEWVTAAMLEPVASVEDGIRRLEAEYGKRATIAVLPEGPMTIPYLAESTVA